MCWGHRHLIIGIHDVCGSPPWKEHMSKVIFAVTVCTSWLFFNPSPNQG